MGRVKEMSPQGLRKLGIIIKKEKALIDETEWYTICCTAPPIGELHYVVDSDEEQLGMCMKCREGSVFYSAEEDSDEFLGR